MTSTATWPADSAGRKWARRFSDRAIDKLLKLPPKTAEYTVTRHVRVPMRDGVELVADHYAPTTASPLGTVLVRGPYGRGWPFAQVLAVPYAARGYHVIVQSVRGTFGSQGTFDPTVNEAADGADTVAWLRSQPWFTGSFATMGLSYLGTTQWALLQDPPPEMAAAVIAVGPHDFGNATWGMGSFSLTDFLGWCDLMVHQEDRRLRSLPRLARSRQLVARASSGLPIGQSGRELLGVGAPWFESWVEHPDPDDEFWAAYRFTDGLERLQIPVLLIGGWQDVFLPQTMSQYRQLRDRDADVALTVGPWAHTQMMNRAASSVANESLNWLDRHLAGRRTRRRSPVRIYVNHHGWVNLDDWPPPASERVLYLQPGGGLGDTAPVATAPVSTFTYNPADPTPTIGGRLLFGQNGYRNDSRLAQRADVLSFTGSPLAADLYAVGSPVVELSHSSDNPHHDVFVRVSEVDAKGRSHNVSDGFRRFTTSGDGTVRIELDAIAHRFRAGSRIRLLVAGGSHPRFVRNLGTDEPPIAGLRLAPATHTVHHGAGGISRLLLPASERPPSPDVAADAVGDRV